jgi:hypothetical protein
MVPKIPFGTTCFSFTTPDLNLLVNIFIFCIRVKQTLPPCDNKMGDNNNNILIVIIIIIIIICWLPVLNMTVRLIILRSLNAIAWPIT